MGDTTRHGKPRRRGAGFGCTVGCLALLLVLVVGYFVVRDTPRFRAFTESAGEVKAEVGRLMSLRSELVEAYPAASVKVNAERRASGDSDPTWTLSADFVEPRFDLPPADDRDGRLEKAREIARWIVRTDPQFETYDFIAVSFVKKSFAGFVSTTEQMFRFTVAELEASS